MKRIALVVVVIAAVVASVASSEEQEATQVERDGSETTAAEAGETGDDGEAPAEPEEFTVGDTVQLGDAQMVVHEFIADMGPGEFTQPDEGMRYVGVDVELTNTGDDSKNFSTLMQFEIQDGDNRAYGTAFTDHNVPTLDGEAAPGGSRRGTMVFEVPVDTQELRLNFGGDLFARGSATVLLE